MIVVHALEKRTAELKGRDAEIDRLKQKVALFDALKTETAELKAKQAQFETIAARLDALEFRASVPVEARVISLGEDLANIVPYTKPKKACGKVDGDGPPAFRFCALPF